jgi:hypothetical protein
MRASIEDPTSRPDYAKKEDFGSETIWHRLAIFKETQDVEIS